MDVTGTADYIAGTGVSSVLTSKLLFNAPCIRTIPFLSCVTVKPLFRPNYEDLSVISQAKGATLKMPDSTSVLLHGGIGWRRRRRIAIGLWFTWKSFCLTSYSKSYFSSSSPSFLLWSSLHIFCSAARNSFT